MFIICTFGDIFGLEIVSVDHSCNGSNVLLMGDFHIIVSAVFWLVIWCIRSVYVFIGVCYQDLLHRVLKIKGFRNCELWTLNTSFFPFTLWLTMVATASSIYIVRLIGWWYVCVDLSVCPLFPDCDDTLYSIIFRIWATEWVCADIQISTKSDSLFLRRNESSIWWWMHSPMNTISALSRWSWVWSGRTRKGHYKWRYVLHGIYLQNDEIMLL